jgi:hypothetical protein
MKTSLIFKLWSVVGLAALASACGHSSSDAPVLPSETSATTGQYAWVVGTWHMQGEPTSWGDLGADIREIKITPTEASVEKFGHLAAESGGFNTNGYDFGGNCLFRVHAKDFAIELDPSSASAPSVSGNKIVFNSRSYELVQDPGNRDDCDKQIARINQVANDGNRYPVGLPVQQQDSDSFVLENATFNMYGASGPAYKRVKDN